jgi:hypothetical protein
MIARQRLTIRIGLVLAAVGLAMGWWLALQATIEGRFFTFVNYRGAPVYAWGLIVILVVFTPIWVWAVVRNWNWQGHKATGN